MTDRTKRLPTVAVVVPTAGRRPDTLLASVQSALDDPATTEVVVAADIRPDEPLPEVPLDERVRAMRVPNISHDFDERGERAREWAVTCATSEVVLELDDDVVAEPGLVTRHAAHHRSSGGVVVGYLPIAQSNLALRWRPAARYYSRGYEKACAVFESRPEAILDGLWGGNFSMRRSDWMSARQAGVAVGGYHGDLALGLRFARSELVGVFDRSLRAEHRYRRTLWELAADQDASATARMRLHAAYPDQIPAPDTRPRRLGARLVLALAVVVASTRGGWRALRELLVIAAYAAETVRLRPVTDVLVRLLCRTAFERSVRRDRA